MSTKTAHTPGPWTVGEIRPDGEYDERMIDTGPGGAVICSVWPMGEDFNSIEDNPITSTAPEREANARLIAKAPELLAEHIEQAQRMAMWRDALITALQPKPERKQVLRSILEDVIDGLAISHDKAKTLIDSV